MSEIETSPLFSLRISVHLSWDGSCSGPYAPFWFGTLAVCLVTFVRTWQVLMPKFPEAGGYTREEYLALLQSEVEVARAPAEHVFNPALVTGQLTPTGPSPPAIQASQSLNTLARSVYELRTFM